MKKLITLIVMLACFSFASKAQICFVNQTSLSTGNNPQAVIAKDLNTDGKADVVVANTNDNNISVYLGDGIGGFGAPTYFSTDNGPISIARADFNNDGKIDLVTANVNSNNISLLLGNGNGSFGLATNFSTSGTAPLSIISADFNSDGKVDVAVANQNTNNLSVLLGNGAGSFGLVTTYTTGQVPQTIISADFNGDGKIDLATANFNSNDVSVLLGTGVGTFSVATTFTYASSSGCSGIVSADFDGDSKADLAVTNANSNTISVLLGNGNGTFGAATSYGVGNFPYAISSSDYNNDGKTDLAVANFSGGNVSILAGDGTGNFAVSLNFGTGNNPSAIASTDFNGDGKIDLAVSNFGSNNASVLLNSPAFTLTNIINIATICKGDSLLLNASGASTYTWSTGSNNGYYYTPTASATYTVTGSDGCTYTTSTTKVIVMPTPVITISASGPTVFCAGNSVNLNATVVNADAMHFVASSSQSVDLQNHITNLYTSDFTLEAWIKTTSTKEGIINCSNGDSNWENGEKALYIDGSGKPAFVGYACGYIYSNLVVNDGTWHHIAVSWNHTNQSRNIYVDGINQTNSGASDFGASGVSDLGTFHLGMPNGGSGSEAPHYFNGDMKQIRIWDTVRTQQQIVSSMYTNVLNNAPSLLAYYKTIEGSGTTLNDFAGSNTGALQNGVTWITSNSDFYLWNNTLTTPSLTVSTTNMYTLVVTNTYTSCKDSVAKAVIVNALPTLSVNGTNTICAGDNTILTASGASTYTWSNSINTASNSVSPTSSASYTVIGYDVNNCTDTETVNVIVNTLPNIIANATATVVCNGASVTLSGSGANTYTWTGGVIDGTGFIPSSTLNYTVSGTDLNACINSATVAINVNQLPNVTANATSTLVCTGNQITLMGGGATTYTWTNGVTDNVPFQITANQTYTVAGTDANGCINQATVLINVSTSFLPEICLVTADSFSINNIIYWDKTAYTNVDSFIVYRFDVGSSSYLPIGAVTKDSSQFTDTKRNIGGPNGGDPNVTAWQYKLAIKDTCGNIGAKSPYHQTINIQQNNQNISWNAYVIETGQSNTVSGYQVLRDSLGIGDWHVFVNTSGLSTNDPNYSLYPNALYRVDALGFNCNPTLRVGSGNNNTLAAKVRSRSNQNNNRIASAIKKIISTNDVNVYPNPANNVLNIEFKKIADNVLIKIVSVLGSEVYRQIETILNNNLIIDISNLATGTYLIHITTNNTSDVKKIIKQ